MRQLMYISTSRRLLLDSELDAILSVSRRNNKAAGVTGLLLTGGRRFLQALEGEEAAVAATFARIEGDERHFAVVMLGNRETEHRAFGDWAMAYQPATACAAQGDLRATVDALTANIEDLNLRAQFTGFANLHAQAA